MAGQITALAPQREPRRGGRERVSVFVDGEFALGLDAEVAARAGLTVGATLSDDDIARLRDGDEATRHYNDALRFLSFRPRSAVEVERYLRGRGADDIMTTAVVGRLRRVGLVDDEAFARYWIENRGAFSPRGDRALQAELRAKGVDPGRIDEALEETEAETGAGEEERAYQAGHKRLRLLARLDEDEFRRRMYAFLQRRGFGYGTARAVVERLWSERDESERDGSERDESERDESERDEEG